MIRNKVTAENEIFKMIFHWDAKLNKTIDFLCENLFSTIFLVVILFLLSPFSYKPTFYS